MLGMEADADIAPDLLFLQKLHIFIFWSPKPRPLLGSKSESLPRSLTLSLDSDLHTCE